MDYIGELAILSMSVHVSGLTETWDPCPIGAFII